MRSILSLGGIMPPDIWIFWLMRFSSISGLIVLTF